MKCFANAAVRWPGLARASLIVVIIAMVAGCGQRGPRGDDVVGVLPVHVTSIELSRPLGDRRVLDAARARQLFVVTD